MSKWVVFKFGEGSFEQGFAVTLQIGEAGQIPFLQVAGRLPPAPDIPIIYAQWQTNYRSLGGRSRIQFPDAQTTHVSYREKCQQAAQTLEKSLNQWLRSEEFQPIRESVIEHLNRNDALQLFLQIPELSLQRLPWHLCELFERFTNTEIILSTLNYCSPKPAHPPVLLRILAILGNSDGIDLQPDQTLLQQLPNAVVTLLVKPARWQINEQLWQQPWDLLFFAGHSHSQDNVGRIWINDSEALTIADLKFGLRLAVKQGLKLAIFNSCDGLGLACALADLNIPQVIVMREPVPDPVAQAFLQGFLHHFSRGDSFYLAVRKGREQLQGLEGEFPCASWLPVICQNPAAPPLVYPHAYPWQRVGRTLQGHSTGLGLAIGAIGLIVAAILALPKPVLHSRFSLGEQVLITASSTTEKQAGVKAFATGEYRSAIAHFQASLQLQPNDPEARIYLNNARAALQGNFHRIATSVPIGGNRNNAEEILRGVAQAQEELHQRGGIQGKFLQIKIANDDNVPELASQEVAPRLIKDASILAVVGHNASEVSIAAAPVYQTGGLVMISPTSGALELSGMGNYIFRTVPSVSFDANKLVRYAIGKAGKTKFATCTDSASPYSLSLQQQFIQMALENGGQVSRVPCDFSSPEFNASQFVSRTLADGADSLMLIPSPLRVEQGINLIRRLRGRLFLLSGSTMYSIRTLQLGHDAEGMILAVVWYPNNPTGKTFETRAMQLWGGIVNWRTAMAYDATQALITALQSTDSRSGIQNVLHRKSFSAMGASGAVQFFPSGDRRPVADNDLLVQVQSVPGSANGYDFIPLRP
uniref:Extracellular ligand-binding receptor n=1 Tax=Cyanothece sp. (strain PCC 7425 / ATCC 29141) TaxID=395961 RepID=B8HUE7_CYAP4